MTCNIKCLIENFIILIIIYTFVSKAIYLALSMVEMSDKEIVNYIEAIEKTWKNYPILDINLSRKNGYKQISSKIYGTKLYVSYYEADYLTLFKRLRNDKGKLNSKLCKDEEKRCGYLDLHKNILCVKEEEICPINNISFNLFENGTIKEIITDNTKINQLIASEKKYPTIFDINKFSPLYSDEYDIYKNDYSLSNMSIPKVIKKSDIFEENELMKGKASYYFEKETIILYHLIYPGMNVKNPIKFISLIKQPFQTIIFIIDFIFLNGNFTFSVLDKKYKNKKE